MRSIGHFIGGKHVKGNSGRTADVFEPMTGEVQAKVALASKAEVRAAVENAKAAQPEWAATNPQRRARVLMKFLELVARDNDALAELLAREHGKTVPDAKGDIQRGVEVVEFAIGIPHLMKGEYTEGAGPGIDIYSMRQPLGVVAGITPFNFPAMIPMWKFAPAIACGNAFILKPSERDPGVPMKLAELMIEAGLPPGILNVVNGDKEAVDAILDDPDIKAVGFVGSSPIAQYIYERAAANGKRVPVFRRRQEPHDHHARCRHGSGGRCADRRRLRLGRRALHGGLGRGSRRQDHRRPADGEADPARREPEDRPVARSVRRFRPAGDPRGAASASRTTSISASRKARRSRSTAAASRCRATRTASTGRLPVRQRHEGHADLQGRDLRAGAVGGARQGLRRGAGAAVRARIRQRRRDLHPRRRRGARLRATRQCRHGRHQRADPGADRLLHLRRLEDVRASAISTSTARIRSASTPRPRRSPRAGRPASRKARTSRSRR